MFFSANNSNLVHIRLIVRYKFAHILEYSFFDISTFYVLFSDYILHFYERKSEKSIYYSDVGLLCFKSGTLPQDILVNSSISDRARGLLAENYVAEQIVAQGYRLNYWESGGKAELDFVIRQNDSVVTVEVKSETVPTAKFVADFLRQVITRAEHTEKKQSFFLKNDCFNRSAGNPLK